MRAALFCLSSLFALAANPIASPYVVAQAAGTGPRIEVRQVDASQYPRVSVLVHVAYPNGTNPANTTSGSLSARESGVPVGALSTQLQRRHTRKS